MFSNFIKVVYVLSVIKVAFSDKELLENDYVSQESREMSLANEVFVSGSREYYFSNENATKTIVESITLTSTRKNLDITTISGHNTSDLSPAKNAFSAFNCNEKKASSSEENLCKSTLVNYPYSASVQRKGAHYASGALVNRQSLLTAAGVFYHVRESIKLFRVRLGSVDCKKGGVLEPIKSISIHPSFIVGKSAFDLAVLKLAHTLQLTDYIKPIPLTRVKENIVSAKFLTTYWPRLIVNGSILPQMAKERLKYRSMRVSIQRLIPWKTCADLMKARNAYLDETSLCLKPIVTHHTPCLPDVGAPVIADDGLWGITSGWISKQCDTYPSPTVVTRTSLAPVRAWLEMVL